MVIRMYLREDSNEQQNHKLLFHGAKSEINGLVDIDKSRANNDFGKGFYTGESYNQAISFISGFSRPCVYFFDFEEIGLKCKKYEVNREWMMTIAYYRGALDEYKNHSIVQRLVAQSKECDYIVAPIADNRMFQIINSFISGEITDEQCKHCLAATNLGYQYVFITPESLKHIKMAERCYIPNNEKGYYKKEGLRNGVQLLFFDKRSFPGGTMEAADRVGNQDFK